MTRDGRRSRVYDAEQQVRTIFDRADERGLRTVQVLGSTITLPVERKFASLDSVQNYVDGVLALAQVRASFARASTPVRVRQRAGVSAAHYEPGSATIAVPLHHGGAAWALRELVVLHEIAHHLAPANSPEAAHGPMFLDRYLTLVGLIVGVEAELLLRATMHSCGVDTDLRG